MLGYRYYSEAIKSEDFAGSADSVGLFESPLSPTGKPGTRAPHLILRQRSNGSKLSTLDLFGKNFVLLTGKDGNMWVQAANSVANYLRTKIDTYRIGGDGDNDDCELVDINCHFYKRFALSFDGAVLIRPDGFVAWRSRSLYNYKQDSATKKLRNIVSSVLLVTSRRITEDLVKT